jgi:hypothetical protein
MKAARLAVDSLVLFLGSMAMLGCTDAGSNDAGADASGNDAGSQADGAPGEDTGIVDSGGGDVGADQGSGNADAGHTDAGHAEGGATGCASLVPPLPATNGPSVHVAGNGSDTAGDGSAAHPFATLAHALSGAVPGTRVYLGGGGYCHMSNGSFDATYCPTEFQSLTVNGTAAEPIVVTAEPGQNPVFDYSLLTNAAYPTEAAVTFSKSSYLVVDSIEMQNSPNGALTFGGGASFCTLTRSKIHDIQFQAIEVMGHDFVIAGNETYNLVLENTNGQPTVGYWPSCNMSWFATGDESNPEGWTERVQWLENDVHDCWGEGINGLFADTVDIIGNTIRDTYSHKIYLDHGRDVRVLRNLIYQTSATSYAGGPNAGVAIDDEYYSGVDYMHQDDILIANNYFGPNLFRTLFRFDTNTGPTANANIDNTWSNVHFVFNVVQPSLFDFASVLGDSSGRIAPSGGVIADNVFLGQPTFELGDPGAWTVSDNSFPQALATSSFGGNVPTLSGNFVATPSFVGPTDGSTLAGFALNDASNFKVAYDGSLVQMPASMPNYSVATFLDQETLVLQDSACADRTPETTAGLWQP